MAAAAGVASSAALALGLALLASALVRSSFFLPLVSAFFEASLLPGVLADEPEVGPLVPLEESPDPLLEPFPSPPLPPEPWSESPVGSGVGSLTGAPHSLAG